MRPVKKNFRITIGWHFKCIKKNTDAFPKKIYEALYRRGFKITIALDKKNK